MGDEQIAAIHRRLDVHSTKLDEIKTVVTELSTSCRSCRREVREHDVILHGDGKDGLTSRVVRLETVRDIRHTGFWAAVACFSAVISGLVVAVFRVAIGLLPKV